MAIAMRRTGSCAFDGILSIDQTLRERVFRKVHIKDAFGVSQCFGAVDVLPVCVVDIKGSQFLLARKKLRAFDIDDAHWQDVDSPEALAHAESIFDVDFPENPLAESLVDA